MAINNERLQAYLDEMRDLQQRVGRTEFVRRFEKKVLDLFARGQIDTADIDILRRELERLFGGEFQGFSGRIRQSYDDVLEVVNTLYDDLGLSISRDFQRVRAIERAIDFQLGEYRASTIESVAREIRRGVIENVNVRDLEQRIFQIGGKAAQYAEAISKTGIKRYGRVSRYQKALIANIQYFQYQGVLRETTRPFCRVNLRKIFHINTILQMLNGNLEPVIENCGGWNCIHEWEPDGTATAEDAVQGQFYTLKGGVQVFGEEGTGKRFRYSIGLENLVNREGIDSYISGIKKTTIKDDRLEKIQGDHYPNLELEELREKAERLRSNPERIFYQHDRGPKIVFEKDGEFGFFSARKMHTVFRPTDYDKYVENFVSLLVKLEDNR